jgi:TRAP-type C4-dicarboxylate transport system substrate-binding protein
MFVKQRDSGSSLSRPKGAFPSDLKDAVEGLMGKGEGFVKKGKRMAAITLGFLIFASLPPHFSLAQQKVITLSYSHIMPVAAKQSILADEWCKEVQKRTNGRVKIDFYPGATLIPARQTYEGIIKGVADVGCTIMGYTRGRFPLMEVADLPLGYPSGYAATRMINDLYKKFNPKELNDVKVLYLHAHGPGLLATRTRVENLEDLRNMKIRAIGLSAKVVQALGGAPVALPITATYDALAKGVVEGVFTPLEALQNWRLAEVTKYTTESYRIAYSTGFVVFMNKGRWNSLPPDIRKIMEETSAEWIEKTAKLWEEMDKDGRSFAEQAGMTFVPLSDQEEARWLEAVKPLFDEYLRNTSAKGLPGEEALDFCFDYLKTLDN